MNSSGSDKGKRSVMEAASSSEKAPTTTELQIMMMMQKEKEKGGSSRDKTSSLSFTELLAQEGNLCSGLEKFEEESNGEKSGVSISMKSGKRGSGQLPNLDLSLLPSRESFELLRTPQRSSNQWPPFSGLRSPYFGGVAPSSINTFRKKMGVRKDING